MTFKPDAKLTYFRQNPTLVSLNGTFTIENNVTRAYSLNLDISKSEERSLVQQAKRDGVLNVPPTAGKLPTSRINAVLRSISGIGTQGWNARLNRRNPTTSGGEIEPEQLKVTREKVKFPGTENTMRGRITELFTTSIDEDGALTDPKPVGQVISYELGSVALMHRKVDSDAPNEGRILYINAHGEEQTTFNKKGVEKVSTMPLPDGITIINAVPSGYDSFSSVIPGMGEASEIGKLAKERPRFGATKKIDEYTDVTMIRRSKKFRQLKTTRGALLDIENDAKALVRASTGTPRAGHIADSLLTKFHGIRNGEDVTLHGEPALSPIVGTRGGETYDQIAFTAFNDENVDIVTIRDGKKLKRSELVKMLWDRGILSQYDAIYDPSCRGLARPPFGVDAPRWYPANDNKPDDAKPLFVKRTQKRGGDTGVAILDDSDKHARDWLNDDDDETSAQAPQRSEMAGETRERSPIEIPFE